MLRPTLALDLSSHTGWAVGRPNEKPRHGVWLLNGNLGERCSCLASSLEDALAVFDPARVIMEAPLPPQAQTAAASARLQFGLAAVTEMICVERSIACEEASAIEVRKLVMGRARVDKDGVVGWCRSQGWEPYDHNDADALALLMYRHLLSKPRVTA